MRNFNYTFQLFFALLVVISACDPSEPAPEIVLSDSKDITSFELIIEGETYTASIVNNEIKAEVKFGTDRSASTTTIVIADKSTIEPASGAVVDFTEPVTYKVTAEDGSTADYVVTVTDIIIPISIERIQGFPTSGLAPVQRRDYILIFGENFVKGSSSVELFKNQEIVEMTIIVEEEDRIGFLINENTPLGEHSLFIKSGGDFAIYPEKLLVDYASPIISDISPTEVIRGGTFEIIGDFFATESENQVHLSTNPEIMAEVLSATKTTISVKVPVEVEAAEYTISVTSNGYQASYNTQKIKVINDPATPIINQLDATSYKKGETITITGENLGKEGSTSEIIFTRFTSGSDQTVTAEANAEGNILTYLIPASFDTGTYSVAVKLGEFVSEEYDEIIQISN